MNSNYIPEILASVMLEWDKRPIPNPDEIIAPTARNPIYQESFLVSGVIQNWLGGRSYREIHEYPEMQIEQPFVFLNGAAAAYYIGGYLYYTFLELGASDSFCPDFPEIVLSYYMAGDRIINNLAFSTIEEKRVILRVYEIFGMSEFYEPVRMNCEQRKILDGNKTLLLGMV